MNCSAKTVTAITKHRTQLSAVYIAAKRQAGSRFSLKRNEKVSCETRQIWTPMLRVCQKNQESLTSKMNDAKNLLGYGRAERYRLGNWSRLLDGLEIRFALLRKLCHLHIVAIEQVARSVLHRRDSKPITNLCLHQA